MSLNPQFDQVRILVIAAGIVFVLLLIAYLVLPH